MSKAARNVMCSVLICGGLFVLSLPSVAGDNTCTPAHAASLWPKVAGRLSGLLGVKAPPAPSFAIEKSVRETSLWSGTYDGKAGTAHVQCVSGNIAAFDSSVRHEETHHFLYSVYGRVPFCLDEGLATYMESGTLDDDRWAEHINASRLREFDNMLQWDLVPTAEDLLSSNVAHLKASQFYASCWALTFYLLHDDNAETQKRRRAALISMLQGGGANSFAILNNLAGGKMGKWELRWHQALWRLRDKASDAPPDETLLPPSSR